MTREQKTAQILAWSKQGGKVSLDKLSQRLSTMSDEAIGAMHDGLQMLIEAGKVTSPQADDFKAAAAKMMPGYISASSDPGHNLLSAF